MKMAWRDLFTYSFISLPPHPPVLVKLHCGQSLIPWNWEGQTQLSQIHTKTHTAKNRLSSQHQWHFFLLLVFNRSFSLVIHKSSKCPFQAAHKHPHRSPKMPLCGKSCWWSWAHSDSAPYSHKWWISKWMSTLQSARQGQFWASGLRCPSELARCWSRGVM